MGVDITGTASNTDTLAHNIDILNILIFRYTIYYLFYYPIRIKCVLLLVNTRNLYVILLKLIFENIINIKFEIT